MMLYVVWVWVTREKKTDENVIEEKLCEIIFCLGKEEKSDSLRFIFVPLGID